MSPLVRALPFALTLLTAAPRAQTVPELPASPVPALLEMLRSDVAAVRRAGADGLAAIAGRHFAGMQPWHAHVPLLRVAATDGEADVVLTATAVAWRLDVMFPAVTTVVGEQLGAWRQQGAAAATLAKLEAVTKAPAHAWFDGVLVDGLLELAEAGPARAGALALLAVLGDDAAAARERLTKLYAEVPPSERWCVALALAGARDPSPMSKALDDGDARLRLAAAWAHQRSDATTLPAAAVVPWLADDRAVVQLAAMAALPRVATIPPAALVRVAERADDEPLRDAALGALTQLGPRAAPATATLTKLVREQAVTPSAGFAYAVLPVLGAIGPGAAGAVDELVDLALAASPDSGLSWHVGAALARISAERALPRAIEAFRDDAGRGAEEQWPSMRLLVGMGAAASGEIGFFLHQLASPSRAAKCNALAVLTAFGEKALPALPHVLPLLDDPDGWIRPSVCSLLHALGPAAAPRALPEIEKRLAAESDGYRRLHLLLAASRMGPAAEPLLLAALSDPPFPSALDAAAAVAVSPTLSAGGADRIGALLDVQEKTPWGPVTPWRTLQRPLEEAFVQRAELAPSLLHVLRQRVVHPTGVVRCLAVRARLRELCPDLAAHRGVDAFVAASDPDAMKRALADRGALAAWLRKLCRDPGLDARATAIAVLPLLGDDEAAANVELAAELLVTVGGPPRWAALTTLGAFGSRARPALPRMLDALELDNAYALPLGVQAIRRVRDAR